MNIKQFIWVAFFSISAIFAMSLLMTGFRPLLSRPIFLGLMLFFILLIVVLIYNYLGE